MPSASFIALDEEMTGIMLPNGMGKPISKEETPADRYVNLKLVPERYAIIQLGICLFEQKSVSVSDTVENASFRVVRCSCVLLGCFFPLAHKMNLSLNLVTATLQIYLVPSCGLLYFSGSCLKSI
jgi:CAF1 family ribonuclease